MITSADLQELLRPELEEAFAALGHDLVIVRPGEGSGGWSSDGRRAQTQPTRTPVRGLLMPADAQATRAAAEAGLPIPRHFAYLPHDAPVDAGGWHLEHGGVAHYPLADARDEGGQGVLWVVSLGAPGERSA